MRTNLNSLSNLNNFAKMFNPEKITANVINALANRGEDIINEAYESGNWFDDKGNLHDSFVSAVFLKGKIVDGTVRYVGEEKSYEGKRFNGQILYGRDEANRFLIDYENQLGEDSGITLVIGAAMFYGSILEHRGYNVISHVSYMLDDIMSKGINVDTGMKTGAMIHIGGSVMRTNNEDGNWFEF